VAESGVPFRLVTPTGKTIDFNRWVFVGNEPTGRLNKMPSPNDINSWKSISVAGTGVGQPLRVFRPTVAWNSLLTDPTQRALFESKFDRIVESDPFLLTSGILTWDLPAWAYMSMHGGPTGYQLLDSDSVALYTPTTPTNTRPAMNVSNAAYRAGWIAKAKTYLDAGAAGIWIDDVTLDVELAMVRGTTQAAVLGDFSWWPAAVVDFMEQIRAELDAYKPGVEIVHNSVWHADSPVRWTSPVGSVKQVDYGFALTTEGWTPATTGTTATWNSAQGKSALGCLQMGTDGSTFSQGVKSPILDCVPNSYRSFSVWIKAPLNEVVIIGIGQLTSPTGTTLGETTTTVHDGTGDWVKVNWSMKMKPDATAWYALIKTFSLATQTWYIDDAALTNGAFPIDYGKTTETETLVRREIAAADFVNIEGGFADPALTSLSGHDYSMDDDLALRSMFRFIDACHEEGTNVIAEQWVNDNVEREYVLATWLYACRAGDGIGINSELPSWPNIWDKWCWEWGARTARSDDGTILSSTLQFGTAGLTPTTTSTAHVIRASAPFATGASNSPMISAQDADFQKRGMLVTPAATGFWAPLVSAPGSTSTVRNVHAGEIWGVRVKLKVLDVAESELPFTLRVYTSGTARTPDVAEVHRVQTPLPARSYSVGSIIELECKFEVPARPDPAPMIYPDETLYPDITLFPGPDSVAAAEAQELGLQVSVDAITNLGALVVGEVFVNQLTTLDDELDDYGDGDTRGWRWDGTPHGTESREYKWEDSSGVLQLVEVAGMEPIIRKQMKNRPQRHGITVGRGKLGGMTPSFTGQFIHDGPPTQESLRRQLLGGLYEMTDAWGTLYWSPSDSETQRSVEVQLLEKPDVQGGLFKSFQFMLVTRQPFIRGGTMKSAYTSLLSDPLGGGLTFPLTFPLDFTDPGLAGANIFVNEGENITYPKITIIGPLTNFVVRNYTTGAQLRTTGGVTIGASDTVVIDMWDETIYKNGDPAQPLMQYLDTVQSEFWEMRSGENLIGISGSAPDPVKTRARVDWWDSYV
jgi:hypothetical protein